MATPAVKDVLCPIVIGRTTHLDALRQHLAAAQAGRGMTVLIAGEAGIGKSRLLKEARTLANEQGFAILQGNCFEPDRTLPYAPFLDLLRTFCAPYAAGELALLLRPFANELMLLLPELASLWPELTPLFGGDPEQEKRRLFQSLARFLRELHRPRLVVIEDIHWCDETTLEFLLFLARQLPTQPLLLLLTYRNDETTIPLNQFLAALDRARLAREVLLARLPRTGTEAMISAIFAQSVHQEFVEKIHELTEGNPFFVEETLKALVTNGDIFYRDGHWTRKALQELQIPRTVQVAVAQRVGQLSAEAQRVLTLAAVAGRRFDFSLLQAITGHSEAELVGLVKELLRAQLVVEESAESFAFRHALTQQAIYSDLLQRERRQLHRAVAEAIELLHSDAVEPKLAELSFHYASGEVALKSYEYGRRAGERAQALHAPRAAVEHFTRALNAVSRMPGLSALEIASLLRSRGHAYEQLGEFEFARTDHEVALAAAQAAHEPRIIWQAYIDLGYLWAQRDFARTGDYFQQALEIVRGMYSPALLAHTLKRLGNWHMNVEHVHDAVQYLNEALAVFEVLHDKQGMAETLDLLGIAYFSSSNAVEGAHAYERAIALFRELGNREGELASLLVFAPRHSVYINNAATWPTVSLKERLADGERALQMARELGAKPAEVLGLIWLGNSLGTSGDYGRALALTQEGLALAEQIEHLHFVATAHMILGTIYWDMLLLDDAQSHLERAVEVAHESHSLIWLGCIVGYLASTLVQRGEFRAAEHTLTQMWNPELPMLSHGQRQLWCARAELALASHEPQEALGIVERLINSDQQAGNDGDYAVPRLAYLGGSALALLGRYADAEAMLTGASAYAQEVTPMLWRLHLALGNSYRRQNRRDQADQSYAAARALLAQLAATINDAELRNRFVAQTKAQFPLPTEKQAAKQAFAGLTAKERTVAALIAQGKSNKEIAEVMVVSHRTVESHVSNLLAKLHLDSRAQIALWAREKGLAEV